MITPSEARQIVERMKDEFDSHDFIQLYACAFPLSYLDTLWEYDGNATTANSQIAQHVDKMCNELGISKGEDVYSKNIRGNVTPCKLWTKIA